MAFLMVCAFLLLGFILLAAALEVIADWRRR